MANHKYKGQHIMASKSIAKKRKAKYRVSFKHPKSGRRMNRYFDTKSKQEHAFRHFDHLEFLVATNQPWEHLWNEPEEAVTLEQVFDLFTNNALPFYNTIRTEAKYKTVIKSVLKVFAEDTPVSMIRGMENWVNGAKYQGWNIYKASREYTGRTRRGINKYLSELKQVFDYAIENGGKDGNGLISSNPIRKSDKYTKAQLDPIKVYDWSINDRIRRLFLSPGLSDFHKELLNVYVMIGARAREILGFNYFEPDRVLKWQHVDFKKNIIHLFVGKSNQTRKTADVHPSAMAILKKWRDELKFEYPLPFGYDKLRAYMLEIKEITGLDFTNHDLRRLKAQLSEKSTNNKTLAAWSIGDTSADMAQTHYAPTSIETMQAINNAAFDQLTHELKDNSAN